MKPSMQFFNASYGNKGDKLRPQFEVRGNSVFTTLHHPDGIKPLPYYQIRGSKIYATKNNPIVKDPRNTTVPFYEIRGSKIHTTQHHPEHASLPHFSIKKLSK